MAEMTDKRKDASDATLLQIVEQLGDCSQGRLTKVLKDLADSGETDNDCVALACAFVISDLRNNDGMSETVENALDILGKSSSEVAHAFMKRLVIYSKNAPLLIGAVEHLGEVHVGKEVTQTLHGWIEEQIETLERPQGARKSISPLALAALRALPDCTADTATTQNLAWQCVMQTNDRSAQQSQLYDQALTALTELADPSLPQKVIDELSSSGGKWTYHLDLLSILGRLPHETLRKHREELGKALVQALPQDGSRGWLRDSLRDLCQKISSTELLHSLADKLTQRNSAPEEEGGKVVSSVIAGLPEFSHEDCRLCLKLTRWDMHSQPRSACVRVLQKHRNRFAAEILQDIAAGSGEKQSLLRRPEPLLAVFEDVNAVAETAISTLAAIDDDTDTEWLGGEAMRLILGGIIYARSKELPTRTRIELQGFGDRLSQADTLSPEDRKLLYKVLDKQKLWPQVTRILERILNPKTPTSVGDLLCELVDTEDELARRFVSHLIDKAEEYAKGGKTYPPESSACRRVEQLLGEHQQATVRTLADGAMEENGALGAYLLGLIRRLNLGIDKYAREMLGREVPVETKLLAISELGKAQSSEAAAVLCTSAKSTASDMERTSQLRAAALRALGNIYHPSDSPTPSKDVIDTIRDRFEGDRAEVRYAAYDACSLIGDARFISSLKDRGETETDDQAVEKLNQALRAIGQQLKRNQPTTEDVESVRNWLGYVRELADPSFRPQVAEHLNSPHPDRTVRVRAVKCLVAFGEREDLEICEQYYRDTAPHGAERRAVAMAIASLSSRTDIELLEALPWLLGEESRLCDPQKVNYEKLFGETRCGTIAAGMTRCRTLYEQADWDSFVTKADGVAHAVIKGTCERNMTDLGLSRESLHKKSQKHGNLLGFLTSQNGYEQIGRLGQELHNLRQKATVAHLESEDGSPKPGITDPIEAEEALQYLRKLFRSSISSMLERQ